MAAGHDHSDPPGRGRALAAGREALARLTGEIVRLKGRTGRALYDMGVRLARIHEERLWAAGEYATFEEYVERGVDLSRTTAYKLMRVAREFNAAIAERYGVEKLTLGLRYLDATPARERPGDLLAADIRIRDKGGRWTSVPFHAAKTGQIREAIALIHGSRLARRRVPADLAERARALSEALPPAPEGMSAGSRVRLRRGRDGRVAATFAAIPLDELEAFLEAVRRHLL